jgi:CubicO group peptidase (beta-lactamase class C family)
MMLMEDGLISLDDPVHRYIPEWRDLQVYRGGTVGAFRTRPPTRPMLIIDLLRHTSALTYGFQQRTNVDAAYREQRLGEMSGPLTLDAAIAALAKLPLDFSPGELWNYSISTDMSVSLFSEATYAGVGFGLGFAVTMDPARALLPGTAGEVSWGGMASTYFWIDPREELIVIFMTQLVPSTTWPIRRDLRTLVYSALE